MGKTGIFYLMASAYDLRHITTDAHFSHFSVFRKKMTVFFVLLLFSIFLPYILRNLIVYSKSLFSATKRLSF